MLYATRGITAISIIRVTTITILVVMSLAISVYGRNTNASGVAHSARNDGDIIEITGRLSAFTTGEDKQKPILVTDNVTYRLSFTDDAKFDYPKNLPGPLVAGSLYKLRGIVFTPENADQLGESPNIFVKVSYCEYVDGEDSGSRQEEVVQGKVHGLVALPSGIFPLVEGELPYVAKDATDGAGEGTPPSLVIVDDKNEKAYHVAISTDTQTKDMERHENGYFVVFKMGHIYRITGNVVEYPSMNKYDIEAGLIEYIGK